MPHPSLKLLLVTACLTAVGAHAASATDPAHDFLPTYAGAHAGDLDVLSAFVTYNPNDDTFVFSGTFDANLGTTPGASYIFGVNRGGGAAAFAGIGITNVLFDSVVRFNQNGSGAVNRTLGAGLGSTALAAGTAQSFGSTIIGVVSGSLLPSNGWAKADYTWNLWPRAGNVAGTAAISDFAPNNSNLRVTVLSAVPEPGTALLLAAGLGLVALKRRRPAA